MKFSHVSAAVVALVATSIVGLSGARASDALVSTEWLAKNHRDPKVRVIEVSVNPGVFERGHVPGASNLVWHTDLADTVRRDIVSKDNLQKLLRQAGVDYDSTLVLYGDTNNWFAAWGAWVLDIYGVKNVKLLDGGRRKWEAEKRELSSQVAAARAAGNVTLADANPALRARLPDVLASAEKKSSAKLVDIRSADEYNGKVIAPAGIQELAIRAGHVPGAVNVPWGEAVAADGTFKSAADLKALYGSMPVITYCRIGERSSHTWFALVKILGYDVKNYDGSWTEYGNAVGVPIVNVAGTIWTGK
jgi:thiosulfate/3-mercaptopyruvate sulfurtransferase